MDEPQNVTLISSEAVLSTAIQFGQQLKNAPEYQDYLAARESVENSARVRRVHGEMLRARSAVQHALNTGGNVTEELKIFQEKQQQYENLPEMNRLFQAQQELIRLFETIAGQISKSAGLDFVEANARQGSCCG